MLYRRVFRVFLSNFSLSTFLVCWLLEIWRSLSLLFSTRWCWVKLNFLIPYTTDYVTILFTTIISSIFNTVLTI